MALKGFGYGCKTQAEANSVASLNVDWFYTWNQVPNYGTSIGAEFIPMLYSDNPTRITNLPTDLAALNPAPTALLGFNEPDHPQQTNMSALEALNTWTPMMTTGLRLGSPVTISPNAAWMSQFMGASNALDTGKEELDKDFRVDFVTAHIYQNPSVNTFLGKVDALYAAWGKPVWVTETAVADFTATVGSGIKSTRYTRAEVEQYMKDLWVEIEKRPWLERFAWKTRSNSDEQMWFSSVFNSNGTRTSTGVTYANLTGSVS